MDDIGSLPERPLPSRERVDRASLYLLQVLVRWRRGGQALSAPAQEADETLVRELVDTVERHRRDYPLAERRSTYLRKMRKAPPKHAPGNGAAPATSRSRRAQVSPAPTSSTAATQAETREQLVRETFRTDTFRDLAEVERTAELVETLETLETDEARAVGAIRAHPVLGEVDSRAVLTTFREVERVHGRGKRRASPRERAGLLLTALKEQGLLTRGTPCARKNTVLYQLREEALRTLRQGRVSGEEVLCFVLELFGFPSFEAERMVQAARAAGFSESYLLDRFLFQGQWRLPEEAEPQSPAGFVLGDYRRVLDL